MFYKRLILVFAAILLLDSFAFAGPTSWTDAIPSLNPLVNAVKIWKVACKTVTWHADSNLLDGVYNSYKGNRNDPQNAVTHDDAWDTSVRSSFMARVKTALIEDAKKNGKEMSVNEAESTIESYIKERYDAEAKIREVMKDLESQGKLDEVLKQAFPNRDINELKKCLNDPRANFPEFTDAEMTRLDNLKYPAKIDNKILEKLNDKSHLQIKNTKDPNWKSDLRGQINSWADGLMTDLANYFKPARNEYQQAFQKERETIAASHPHVYLDISDYKPIGYWENGQFYDLRQISPNMQNINVVNGYQADLVNLVNLARNNEIGLVENLTTSGNPPEQIESTLSFYHDNNFYPKVTSDIVDPSADAKLETLNTIAENISHTHTTLPKEYLQITSTELQNDLNGLNTNITPLQKSIQTQQNDIISHKVIDTYFSVVFNKNWQIQNSYYPSNSKTDLEIQEFLKPDKSYDQIKDLPQTKELNTLFDKLADTYTYASQLPIYNQIETLKNTNTALKEFVDLRLLKLQISNEYKNGNTYGIDAKNINDYFGLRKKQIDAENKLIQTNLENDIKNLKNLETQTANLNNQIKTLPHTPVMYIDFFPAVSSNFEPPPGHPKSQKQTTAPPSIAPPPMINPVTPAQPSGPICH